MIKAIKDILPTAEAIQRLLHPHAEVVIHDIKKNKIAAIYHPFSKRRVGDPSLLTQEEMPMVENCVGPYEKINWDGRKLKSVSSIIHDEKGNAVGLFCINLDVSYLKKVNDFIAEFIGFNTMTEKPKALFKDDWQEKIHQTIHLYLNNHHLSLKSLTRTEKKKLIEYLHKVGVFNVKNAASYIAKILNVSRATIYNYLGD